MTPFAVLNASKYYVSKLPAECKMGGVMHLFEKKLILDILVCVES